MENKNNEMTLKIPRCVHKSLKTLAVARSMPMYAFLARLILDDINNQDSKRYEEKIID